MLTNDYNTKCRKMNQGYKLLCNTLLLLVASLALYECVYGILQVFCLAESNHAHFVLTGTFNNPGPYGCLIAIALAILGSYVIKNNDRSWYDKALLAISTVACFLCIVVLPSTLSRAAWLSFGVAALVFLLRECNLATWITKHKSISVFGGILLLVIMLGIFFIKKDSAIGRFHIWHMELLAITDSPWVGHGSGSVLRVYGDTQAEFFMKQERSSIITKVAGCPEYAFNEYLKIGVEHGVICMLVVVFLLITLIKIMLRYCPPFGYGLIVLSVFAFFSYPLEAFEIKTSHNEQKEKINSLISLEMYEDACAESAPLYDLFKSDYRYLYNYGYAKYKCGDYEESLRFLSEGAQRSSDPMFYNMMGKNYESLGMYDKAESMYLHAYYMVPQRLYPLSLLMKLNIKRGRNTAALRYGNLMLRKPINMKHESMKRLRAEARFTVDSLQRCK